MKARILIFSILILLMYGKDVLSQNVQSYYKYDQLSNIYYKNYRDSIKKHWKCPSVFKSKSAQKEYETAWESRKERIITEINNNSYIHDDVVYNYINDIFNELVVANKDLITTYPQFFVDRSEVANAYAFGEHIIVVNLGLILRSHSREEIALYLAHELAHDILKHSDHSMRNRAELVSSDEYKESLKDILSSKYERFSKLKKVMEGYTFDRTRHSRYNESEADSLGILILSKTKLDFDASNYLNLDTMDKKYKHDLKTTVKEHFNTLGISTNDNWYVKKSKGLSNSSFNIKDSLFTNEDSLKTHPDCMIRYEKNKHLAKSSPRKTEIPKEIKDAAFQIAIFGMIVDNNLCKATYSLLQEKETNPELKNYEQRIGDILNSLVYASKKLSRFNALRIQKKNKISDSYYQLQNFLEQIPESDLNSICSAYNKAETNKNDEYKKMIAFYSIILTDNFSDIKAKIPPFSKEFENNFPNSIYLEYIK